MDELFVTYLNDDSENITAKRNKNYLDLFINTSLNHISIRSCLISLPKHKLISNSEQLFNTIDLSPINISVVLPPNSRGKNSQPLKLIRTLRMKIVIRKYLLPKYY